jgi:glycosyltransferase involved in cell wall biosynthesis
MRAVSKESRTKICIVSRCAWTFYNFRFGLAQALARLPNTSVVGAGVDLPPYAERIEAAGIPFRRLRGRVHGQNPVRILLFAIDLFLLYRKFKPHIAHHFTIKPVIFGTIAARLAGVPRIVNTITGLGRAFDEGNAVTGFYVKFLYRLALRFSHHVFFQNEEDRSLFVREGLVAEGKTSIVPGSGVDLEKFRPGNAQSWNPRSGDRMVLMAARLLRTKGVAEFAEAARLVRQTNPGVVFVLLGGLDFGNPAAVAESELRSWTKEGWIQWIEHRDDVRPLLRRADVVVLPSYYREGVPRSLLEAAAMGKPIITTDNTGCREVVEPGVNGLMVPTRDARALADAIVTLLGDEPARARMGEAGRRRMVERFDERFIVERAVQAYGL